MLDVKYKKEVTSVIFEKENLSTLKALHKLVGKTSPYQRKEFGLNDKEEELCREFHSLFFEEWCNR